MAKCKHKDTTKMSFKLVRGKVSIEICHHCNLVWVSITEEQVVPLEEFRKQWNSAMLKLKCTM